MVGLVALMFAGIFFYAKFINDAPDKLDDTRPLQGARPRRRDRRTRHHAAGCDVPGVAPHDGRLRRSVPGTTPSADDFDGDWVPTSRPSSATGSRRCSPASTPPPSAAATRSTGLLTIDGTPVTAVDFTVDMSTYQERRVPAATASSSVGSWPPPSSRRPTFVLTAPIDFGAHPRRRRADHGVGHRRPHPARRHQLGHVRRDGTDEDGRIGVLGTIPVLFADYGIPTRRSRVTPRTTACWSSSSSSTPPDRCAEPLRHAIGRGPGSAAGVGWRCCQAAARAA